MNTTMQWADLWTNDLKRWEQKEYLRKERGMMMESESTKVLLSMTKSTTILDLFNFLKIRELFLIFQFTPPFSVTCIGDILVHLSTCYVRAV